MIEPKALVETPPGFRGFGGTRFRIGAQSIKQRLPRKEWGDITNCDCDAGEKCKKTVQFHRTKIYLVGGAGGKMLAFSRK